MCAAPTEFYSVVRLIFTRSPDDVCRPHRIEFGGGV